MVQNKYMTIKQKVMVFIARPKDEGYEWLTRHNAPHPDHGGARWYIVTGNVEPGESQGQAAIREAAEETGITDVQQLITLPLISTYQSDMQPDIEFVEQAYLLVTNHIGSIVLNEESDDSQWLGLDDFVAKIWWTEDKEALKTILSSALANKQ